VGACKGRPGRAECAKSGSKQRSSRSLLSCVARHSPSLPPYLLPRGRRHHGRPLGGSAGGRDSAQGGAGLEGEHGWFWARGVGEGEKKREGESDEKSTSGLPRGEHLIHFFLTCLEVASFVAQEGAAPEIHPHPHPHPPSTHTHTHTHACPPSPSPRAAARRWRRPARRPGRPCPSWRAAAWGLPRALAAPPPHRLPSCPPRRPLR